jgi:phospholipid-binding lipoprotein MlaA
MTAPTTLHFLALILVGAMAPLAEAQTSDRIYTYTTQGSVPVDLNKSRLLKNSYETYSLESAVPQTARAAATPKHKATPKPSPTSKPTPVRKPVKASTPKTEAAKSAPITISKKSPPGSPVKSTPKALSTPADDLDEYGDTVKVADPIEPVNRGMFWVNHQIYTYVARPLSKVYRTIIPKPVRTAVHNVYDNAEYPVRVVNHLLQGQARRADLETRKFLVNSVAGVGGIMKVSDRFPDLAELPSADTGQTFAKWGIGHGPYIVLPVIGPRSTRDTVGFAGDVALNPLTWVPIGGVAQAIAVPLTTPNTIRNIDSRLDTYDAATKNSVDPYTAMRGAYIQYRDRAALK